VHQEVPLVKTPVSASLRQSLPENVRSYRKIGVHKSRPSRLRAADDNYDNEEEKNDDDDGHVDT